MNYNDLEEVRRRLRENLPVRVSMAGRVWHVVEMSYKSCADYFIMSATFTLRSYHTNVGYVFSGEAITVGSTDGSTETSLTEDGMLKFAELLDELPPARSRAEIALAVAETEEFDWRDVT